VQCSLHLIGAVTVIEMPLMIRSWQLWFTQAFFCMQIRACLGLVRLQDLNPRHKTSCHGTLWLYPKAGMVDMKTSAVP
jgi:hypothetical protein